MFRTFVVIIQFYNCNQIQLLMNINNHIFISGSIPMNSFEKQSIQQKIEDVLNILIDVSKVSLHFTKTDKGVKVLVKYRILIGDKIKEIIFSSVRDDLQDATNACLNRLSKKYFRLINKKRAYRHKTISSHAS